MKAFLEVVLGFIFVGLLIWGAMTFAAMLINVIFALIFF